MKVFVKTKDLSRNEWLRYRTKGIGGSDVSIIAGINPYKSVYQLWLEKTGRMIPEQTDSEYAHFGTLLEPIVRKEFTERTGVALDAVLGRYGVASIDDMSDSIYQSAINSLRKTKSVPA